MRHYIVGHLVIRTVKLEQVEPLHVSSLLQYDRDEMLNAIMSE